MSSIVIAGDTSGTVTISAPAVAGSAVLTLPTNSGTLYATTAGGAIPAASGGTGLTSSGATGNVLTSNGSTWTSSPLPASGVTSVSGTAPVASSGGTTPAISMAPASSGVNGYMTGTYATKLDGIAAGATNVTNTNQLTNGAGYTTNTGTVTSVATGNGLQGGTITSTGTLSVACPGYNTVGSYVLGGEQTNVGGSVASGDNRSAGTGSGQVQAVLLTATSFTDGVVLQFGVTNNISGTWKVMSGSGGYGSNGVVFLCCRVS